MNHNTMLLKAKALIILLFVTNITYAQIGSIHGKVLINGVPTELANVMLVELSLGRATNSKGVFHLQDIPFGTYTVSASYVGYQSLTRQVTLSTESPSIEIYFELEEKSLELDAIVVTGTKTGKRQTDSPVIVNMLTSETLDIVQACNLSEGLRFQPGLRVEVNCQTCSYSQLRMNGLAGGYSQILINGRPIFSPLTGLYGMDFIPANMIDRIEVVRGAGSSLYGSSAIGGTVNVITKIPTTNNYELNVTNHNINGQTHDNVFRGNATLVSEDRNSGISFFINRRERGFYDHNDDNFSEIPLRENTSFGAHVFFLTHNNQKLEISLSNLSEYRFGGEMVLDKPAYLTQQSEERTHNVWMGSADYRLYFHNHHSSLITYVAWQHTERKHYTGIIPDVGTPEFQHHIAHPPYGTSEVATYNAGIQINHRLNNFLQGSNVLTFGSEYSYDDVFDEIPSYKYLIDRTTKNFGVFLQSDWEILPSLTVLSGVRMDKHNLVDKAILSPRASILYKYKDNTQFRLNYGTGFRAPQAFDTDMHITFAAGGISRISISPDLLPEQSQSLSASINYDKPTRHYIAGFTIEGFFTRLNDVFYLRHIGQDDLGELFEKHNGQGATVQGVTIELRANYDRKLQFEAGLTLQTSRFDEAVEYIDGLEGIKEFIRTPNDYGFASLTMTPNEKINANINYIHTGTMKVPHFAGAPNQERDAMITSQSFSELSAKVGYTFNLHNVGSKLELYGGIKNIFNSYQDQFDIGKNRDSNFVFGPAQPRTFFIGITLNQ